MIQNAGIEDAIHLFVDCRIVNVANLEVGVFEADYILQSLRPLDTIAATLYSVDGRSHLAEFERCRSLTTPEIHERTVRPVPISHAVELGQEFKRTRVLVGQMVGVVRPIG